MTPRPETLCVLAHRTEPERPRRAVDGLLLCPGCLRGLRESIDSLPALWSELEASLVRSPGRGAPVSGSREAPLPGRLAPAEQRRDMVAVLVSWCRVVAEERGVAMPDVPEGRTVHDPKCPGQNAHAAARVERRWLAERQAQMPQHIARDRMLLDAAMERERKAAKTPDVDASTWDDRRGVCLVCGWEVQVVSLITVLAEWLGRHVEWLAAQPFVDEVVREVRRLRGRAFGLIDPMARDRWTPLNLPCPEDCPGSLGTLVPADGSLLPQELVCDAPCPFCARIGDHEPQCEGPELHRWPLTRPGAWDPVVGRAMEKAERQKREQREAS